MALKLEGGCSPFWGRAKSPCNTMWPGPRPTSTPSFILIHPAVWPQYTNVTDTQADRIGQTDRKTAPQHRANHITNGHPKTESVCSKNACIITTVAIKLCHNKKHVLEHATHHRGKTAGIDMVQKHYVTVTLCIAFCSKVSCCAYNVYVCESCGCC